MSHPRDYSRDRHRDQAAYLARYAPECADCGKKCYPSRKMARAVARILFPGQRMRAYECGGAFHVTSQDADSAELGRRQAAAS
jgi:hypothetical protein